MFKFDTQKQLAGARAERQGRIMASFLGRRTSRLGILRPYWYQFSDQACAQLPDLSTWSLSHSDGSPLSAPCPYLARADRVAEYLPVQVTAAVVSSHSSVCLWSVRLSSESHAARAKPIIFCTKIIIITKTKNDFGGNLFSCIIFEFYFSDMCI